MLDRSTIIFIAFIVIFLLLILGKAIQVYLRKNGAIYSRTEFPPHTESTVVDGPDMTTNNRSARLQSYYAYIDATRVLQGQPDTININSQMGRSHEWARAQQADFRPPVFHIALDMPAPASTTEEDAPPKYDELKFH